MFHKLEHFLDLRHSGPSWRMLIPHQGSYSERKEALSLRHVSQSRTLGSDREAARGTGRRSTVHSSEFRKSFKERVCVNPT
jgi:hypothetical protein